jgi:choline dehydrogenase-like flavoprotein
MFADGRSVPPGEIVTTTVCVVGAGPAGITVARCLAAEGVDLVLLERGGRMGNGRHEDLENAFNAGLPYSVDKARGTGFGGTLHKWLVSTPLGDGFGRLREFASDDFVERPWMPASGWPFGKDELKPYYRAARRWFDVPWPSDDPEPRWDTQLATNPIARASDGVILTEVFAFANPGSFASSASRSLENSESVLVLTNSSVVNLSLDDTGSRVSAVQVATETGRYTVAPRVVVLAAGAIENARLLLASRDRQQHGIGNSSGMVGRYFMEHPRFTAGVLEPTAVLQNDGSIWDIHLRDGVPVQRKFRFNPDVCRSECLPNSIFFFRKCAPRPELFAAVRSKRSYRAVMAAQSLKSHVAQRRWPDQPWRLSRRVLLGLDELIAGVGRRHLETPATRRQAKRLEQALTIEVMAEQVPNADSRVALHHERDRWGVPKASVVWQLTDADLAGWFRGLELFRHHLERGGIGKVHTLISPDELPSRLFSASHQMGTTRMAASAKRGVVDADGAVFGVKGLYVTGPSVFPTGGDANPTLTTVALAIRLAHHLHERIRT